MRAVTEKPHDAVVKFTRCTAASRGPPCDSTVLLHAYQQAESAQLHIACKVRITENSRLVTLISINLAQCRITLISFLLV